MTQKDLAKLIQNNNYEYKVINLGNDTTQIIVQPRHINCAMCNTRTLNKESVKIQDRRIVALVVERKYCTSCADNLKSILNDVKGSHKEPIGTMV
jgi:hypothetical protein